MAFACYITNPKIGRRTGKDILNGKKIRKLPDGCELFDDYWTDSESEIEQVSDSPSHNKENTAVNKLSNDKSFGNDVNSVTIGEETPFSQRSNVTDGNSAGSMANTRKVGLDRKGLSFNTRRTLKFSDDQTPVNKTRSIGRKKTPMHVFPVDLTCHTESPVDSSFSLRRSLRTLSEKNSSIDKESRKSSKLAKSHLDGSLFSEGEAANDTTLRNKTVGTVSDKDKENEKKKLSQKNKSFTADTNEISLRRSARKSDTNNNKKKIAHSLIPKYIVNKNINKSIHKSPKHANNQPSNKRKSLEKISEDTFVVSSYSISESDEVFSKEHSETLNTSSNKNINQNNTMKRNYKKNNENSEILQQSQEKSLNLTRKQRDLNKSSSASLANDDDDDEWNTYSSDKDDHMSDDEIQKGEKSKLLRKSKTPVNSKKKQNKSYHNISEKELNSSKRISRNRKRKIDDAETEKTDSEKSIKKISKLLSLPSDRSPTPGVRRSRRTRVPPLEYWRNQRIKYDKELKTIGIEEGFEIVTRKKTERKKSSNLKGDKLKNKLDSSKCSELSVHDKSYLDSNSLNDANKIYSISDYINGDQILPDCVGFYRALEWITPEGSQPTKDDPIQFTKSLIFPNAITGFLKICSLQEKPLQYFPNHSALFIILYGKVSVMINDTTFLLETGDIFHVPVGNAYSIKNVRRDNVKLCFIMFPSPEVLEDCEI